MIDIDIDDVDLQDLEDFEIGETWIDTNKMLREEMDIFSGNAMYNEFAFDDF